MNSVLFSKSEILNILNLKAKYEYIDLIFRDIEVDESFWNTPQQFRNVIQKIKNKAKEEIKNLTSIKRFDKNNRVENQSDINKYILRLYIIQAILSVICRMLEVDAGNFYLEEGEIEKFEDEKLDAEQLFLFFVENAYVNRGIRKKIVNGSLYQQLFSEINNVL